MTYSIKPPESNLYKVYSQALLMGREFPHQSSGMFRPSEASAVIQTKYGPKTKGGCSRQTWFRLKKIPPSNLETLPHQIQRMNVGKEVERSVIDVCKAQGLYVDNNVPFRVEMEGIPIAGELDAILRTSPCGTNKYIAEIKSIYGHYAQKNVLGKAVKPYFPPGTPKDSYLMQLGLYLNHFSRLPKDDPSYIPFGVIFVADRGDGHFGVFEVWLETVIKVLGEGEMMSCQQIFYSASHMGVSKRQAPYSIEDILQKYRRVQQRLDGDSPPPRDFTREYNREQVEQNHELGSISDSAYKKWMSSHSPRGKKKEQLGDWNCQTTYCKWSDYCWSLDK